MTSRMTFWIILTALITIGSILLTFAPALAVQLTCFPWKLQTDYLLNRFGETPHWIDVSDLGVVAVFLNPETGTWTIVGSPNGEIMCPIASGEEWSEAPPAMRDKKPEKPGSDT